MSPTEDTVLLVCIAVGAVVGFTLTGGAAIGTAVGAAVGVGADRALRQHRSHRNRA